MTTDRRAIAMVCPPMRLLTQRCGAETIAQVRTGVVVVFFGPVVAIGAFAAMACSSGEGARASGGTTSGVTPMPPEAPVRTLDAGGDVAADASDDEPDTSTPFQCLDDRPAPIDAGVDAGDTSCPETGACSAECAAVRDHYKLGVAQVAIRCIKGLPSCDEPADVRSCVDKALLAACPDSTATTYCEGLVPACDPNAGGPGSQIDQKGCEAIANGLTASGRATFSNCVNAKIEAGTCPTEVALCADAIRM
jgi:hypothetical protein